MIGFILTWDNIINMFLQPWVGEKVVVARGQRFGRRKPWLMVGAPLAAVFFITVPFVRENFILIALAILGTNLGHGPVPLPHRRIISAISSLPNSAAKPMA